MQTLQTHTLMKSAITKLFIEQKPQSPTFDHQTKYNRKN